MRVLHRSSTALENHLMNFSGLSDQSFAGKFFRYPLRLIPSTMRLPILQGTLKGKQWIVGSGQHGCWLGSYEHDKQQLLAKSIAAGSVVFDLGSHAGFYTLLASSLVGPKGKVVAFEPMPQNLSYLKEHLRLNQITNVTVIEAAVSDRNGTAFLRNTPAVFKDVYLTRANCRLERFLWMS